jgi:hypothetical protein
MLTLTSKHVSNQGAGTQTRDCSSSQGCFKADIPVGRLGKIEIIEKDAIVSYVLRVIISNLCTTMYLRICSHFHIFMTIAMLHSPLLQKGEFHPNYLSKLQVLLANKIHTSDLCLFTMIHAKDKLHCDHPRKHRL